MDKDNLIWIDLEMTGLSFEKDTIVEIATVVTDKNLNILAEGPDIVINHNEEVINSMDPWCIENFSKTGLIEEIRNSKKTITEAEKETISFLEKWVPKKSSPMCGNTTQQDRRMLARLMPELEDYFHYRHIDVSTIKELVLRWSPKIMENFKKENLHRSLPDIKDSINELKFYRENIFKI